MASRKSSDGNGNGFAEVLSKARATVARAKAKTKSAKSGVGSWSDDPDRAELNEAHRDVLAAATKAEAGKPAAPISLPELEVPTIAIRVVGVTELICHKWSEKAIRMMLDKQTGKATAGREHKNPQQDYEDSLYKLSDGTYGFPTIAFKSAAVEACTSLGKTITKVMARQAFHVDGEFVRIEGTPRMRQDMVRVGNEVADIRFRGGFEKWSAVLNVMYNARVLSAEQVINLFNLAGFAVGVGEWRPERNGQFGRFRCVSSSAK